MSQADEYVERFAVDQLFSFHGDLGAVTLLDERRRVMRHIEDAIIGDIQVTEELVSDGETERMKKIERCEVTLRRSVDVKLSWFAKMGDDDPWSIEAIRDRDASFHDVVIMRPHVMRHSVSGFENG